MAVVVDVAVDVSVLLVRCSKAAKLAKPGRTILLALSLLATMLSMEWICSAVVSSISSMSVTSSKSKTRKINNLLRECIIIQSLKFFGFTSWATCVLDNLASDGCCSCSVCVL